MTTGNSNWPTTTDNPDGSPTLGFAPVINGATTTLSSSINAAVTTVPATSTSLFLSSGSFVIDGEAVSYTGKTSISFTGCTRGVDGTTAATHTIGAEIADVPIAANQNDLAQALFRLQRALGYGTHRNWVSALEFGADPTGVSNSRTGIQAAIDSLPDSGGTVYFPPGKYLLGSAIHVGDSSGPGSVTVKSTKNQVHLVGAGAGANSGIIDATVQLHWTGAAGGTMITFTGQTSGGMSGIRLHGGALAKYGLFLNNVDCSVFEDIVIGQMEPTGVGLVLENTGRNNFINIRIVCQQGTLGVDGSSAMTIGADVANDASTGNSQNLFSRCEFLYSDTVATSYGIYLRNADNNKFDECAAQGAIPPASGYALYMAPATNTVFPQENLFDNCPMLGSIGGTSGTGGNILFAHPTSDGEPLPAIPNLTIITYDHVYDYGDKTSGAINVINSAWRAALQDKAGQVYNVKAYGAKGDGTTDDLTAINAAIAALPASGGIVYFPVGTYMISDTIILGDGTTTTESTKHGIKLVGCGSGVGGGESGIQTDGASCIKANSSFSSGTTKPMIKAVGVIHNIGLSSLQLDCNSRAGIGVQTIHAYRFMYSDVYVRLWRGIAWDFNTQTGATSFAVGCGAGSLYDCGCQEPALTTAHAMKMDGNDTTVLDCARIHVHEGSYNFGSDAGARGLWLRFADNCYFYGPLFWTAGSGDQLYFEQATNTAYPGGNKFFPPVITKIGGTSGTGGNLFVGWLSDVDPPRLADCTFITEQGKTFGLRDIASYGAVTASSILSNSTATTNQKTDTMLTGGINRLGLLTTIISCGTLGAVGGDGCVFTFRHRMLGVTAGLVAVSGLAAGTYGWVLETRMRTRTLGASASFTQLGSRLYVNNTVLMDETRRPGNILTVDLTGTVVTDARNSMSVANASNTITTEDLDVEIGRRNRTN